MRQFGGYALFVSLTAALAGLLFGMDTGAISGALPLIQVDFHIRPGSMLLGFITATLLLGAAVGVIISSAISRLMGRRILIMLSSLIFVLCSLILMVTTHLTILILCRFMLGLALGFASYIAPLYLAEITPAFCRGAMVSTYQLMITIGLLVAFLVDTYFSTAKEWHMMLGVVSIPAGILFIMACFLPESPRWLVLKGKTAEAKTLLTRLSNDPASTDDAVAEMEKSAAHKAMGMALLSDMHFLKLMCLGLGMQVIQQWTGINAVMYYAPLLFKSLGFVSLHAQMWCSVAVGLVNVITTIFAVFLVDKLGRRPILFFGLTVMALALIAPEVAKAVFPPSAALGWFNLFMVLLYIVGFAISAGPIVWLICAEIFPLKMRDAGLLFTTCGNWVFNGILGLIFPMALASWGIGMLFIAFACVAILGIFYIYRFVPETKGISLEKMEENIYAGKPLRQIGV